MNLFDDQKVCLSKINSHLGQDKILVQAPTGYGKTVVLSKFLADNPTKSALICFNKIDLIDQTIDKLDSLGAFLSPEEIGVYNGSLKRKEIDRRIVVGTIQSLVKVKEKYHFDFIIFDEAHRSNLENKKSSFYRVVEHFPHKNLIGFTATPYTSKGPIYGEDRFWPRPCYSATTKEMIEKGRLVDIDFTVSETQLVVNTEGVKTNAGDFNQKELNARASVEELVNAQIQDAKNRIGDRYLFPIFMGVSIEHAEMIQKELGNASIVHSKMTLEQRKKNLDDFKTQKTKYLVSVLVLSEGFDFPPADCLVLIRPTKSHVLFVQAVGRVLRTSPGKKRALLLDYGNVITTLGNPLTIKPSDIKKRSDQKICEVCYGINHQSEKKCQDCNEPFLIMCGQCFDMKEYGSICCVNPYFEGLPEDNLEKLLKNTELKPYSPKNKDGIFIIAKWGIYKHYSQQGNNCFKFVFRDKNDQTLTIFGNTFKGWKGNGFGIINEMTGLHGKEYAHDLDWFFNRYDDWEKTWFGKKLTLRHKGFIYKKNGHFYSIKDWI